MTGAMPANPTSLALRMAVQRRIRHDEPAPSPSPEPTPEEGDEEIPATDSRKEMIRAALRKLRGEKRVGPEHEPFPIEDEQLQEESAEEEAPLPEDTAKAAIRGIMGRLRRMRGEE